MAKSKYFNRLPRANDTLMALDDASTLRTGKRGKRVSDTVNVFDEEAVPEASISFDRCKPNTVSKLAPGQLRALAATDEVSDAIDRITSYIVIVPELGTTFAYPQFKDEFDIRPVERDALLAEIGRHWQIVNEQLFDSYASLSLGITDFVRKWFTYGNLYLGIIRDKQYGIPVQIYIQYEPFKEFLDRSGNKYWKTDDDKFFIWEPEDLFVLDYSEIDEFYESYVASLRYSYNTFKNIERTRIANAIMSAQFRSIYTVPTKGLGKVKARQKLSVVMGMYKRNINIDRSSGEVLVNGENQYPVNTELWVSETSAGAVKIENPGDGNPNLNNTDMVEYFMRRFYKRSKLPISKYEAVNTGYLNGLSEIDEDERQFKLHIANHRSVLAKFFISILWRYMSGRKEFVGREDIRKALIFNFYDEPEHKTDEELLEGINDRLGKINDIIDTYTETLEKCGFGESQKTARANVLRYKLLAKYCPDILEQRKEDYRNVPKQENTESDTSTDDTSSSDFGSDDFGSDWGDDWSSESGYDDGTDDFGDYGNDDWDSEFDSNDSDDSWNFNF